MKQDLQKIIDDLFKFAYKEEESDKDYQEKFAREGYRKAQYISDDLRYRESNLQILTSELGYLCIGGADGSEVEKVLEETDISKAVMIEISESAVRRAAIIADRLASKNKELIVYKGDATALLETSLQTLDTWCSEGKISGLICSAQAVMHELPSRSPGFDLSTFLGKLYRNPAWKVCLFYSREPCIPEGWPEMVRIRIPDLKGDQLVRLAQYVRDRLRMEGHPELLASNWVSLPAPLAVETLHKLLRKNTVRRIGYELGEQLTEFDAMSVKQHLQSYIDGMRVSVEYITTSGFKKALQEYEVEYVSHNSESLSVPRTHSEIIGYFSTRPKIIDTPSFQGVPKTDEEVSTQPTKITFSNPFDGDVSDTEISQWLTQFGRDEQPLVAKLFDKFIYISHNRLMELATQLHEVISEHLCKPSSEVYYVPFGGVAKSGGLISYHYRVANKIPSDRFIDYSGLAKLENLQNNAIVFLDDLIASGHQASEEYNRLKEQVKIPADCHLVLSALVSREAGVRYLSERTEFSVCNAIQLTNNDEPLHPSFDLFDNESDRVQLQSILKKYGEILAPRNPFGYAGSGLLLGFAHSTPDNSFPIFWSINKGWRPLLRKGGASRIGVM